MGTCGSDKACLPLAMQNCILTCHYRRCIPWAAMRLSPCKEALRYCVFVNKKSRFYGACSLAILTYDLVPRWRLESTLGRRVSFTVHRAMKKANTAADRWDLRGLWTVWEPLCSTGARFWLWWRWRSFSTWCYPLGGSSNTLEI